jgi:hypothetical protein
VSKCTQNRLFVTVHPSFMQKTHSICFMFDSQPAIVCHLTKSLTTTGLLFTRCSAGNYNNSHELLTAVTTKVWNLFLIRHNFKIQYKLINISCDTLYVYQMFPSRQVFQLNCAHLSCIPHMLHTLHTIYWYYLNVVVKCSKLLLHIQRVLVSNLGPENGYPDLRFFMIFRSHSKKMLG